MARSSCGHSTILGTFEALLVLPAGAGSLALSAILDFPREFMALLLMTGWLLSWDGAPRHPLDP